MIRHSLFSVLTVLFFGLTSCISVNPKISQNYSDSSALKRHVSQLTTGNFRNYQDTAALNHAAQYIKSEFLKYSENVSFQTYMVNGSEYKNVISSIGPENAERIIIGAHYDTYGNQPGADDNASGVAGLLELARLLQQQELKYRIDFVAYTLEEPPFFKSEWMGSYHHAHYLKENNIPVKGMICLEMIGYFNDEPDSQTYPAGILRWFYGNKGDYILVVQKFGNGSFGRKFNRSIRKQPAITTKFLRSPKALHGVDFSDHLNYWKFGYNAVMVTNTAFYRNKNYHTAGDTLDTIDFSRMSRVVDQVYLSIIQLNSL